MQVLGSKIKEARKAAHLSQAELAKGVCTQATISNIESRNTCDSLDIFSQVCMRLGVDVNDFLVPSEEQKFNEFLDAIEDKCNHLKYKEAFNLLLDYSNPIPHHNSLLLDKYNYYHGITSLLGMKDSSEALFYLYQGAEIKDKVNIYNIMSDNAIGTMYGLEKRMDRAKIYHDKSVKMLAEYGREIPKMAYKVFYDASNFYSQHEDYKKSLKLCEQGIKLNKENNSSFYLEQLLYELAVNKQMLGHDAKQDYVFAYYYAKFKGNKSIADSALKDMETHNISFDDK